MYSEYRPTVKWPWAAVFELLGRGQKDGPKPKIEQEIMQSRQAGAKITISEVMRRAV
jgi:hypothetical protein